SVWVALFERDALGKLRGDVLAGVLYGSNWYQIWTGAGYSAGNDFAPLRHLWSLAVEEQFYVVWPLVMIGFVKVGSRRIAGVARWLFLAAIVVTVAVAVLSHSGPQSAVVINDLGVAATETSGAYWNIGGRLISKPDALYLSTISRAGGLLLGSAFAMIWRPAAIMRGPLRNKGGLFDAIALLGFVGLGALCWFVSFTPAQGVDPLLFRGGFFLTGLATLAVIAAVTHQRAVTGKVLSLPVFIWIGTRSYGLYLYHWPIYQIIRNIAANKLRFHEFVLAMVATAIITELSYRFVETPIREGRFGELLKRRRAGVRTRSTLTAGQRKGALGGAAVAALLAVFAVGSMATAELKQNEVAQGIEAGKEFSCNVITGENCDDTGVSDPVTEPAVDDAVDPSPSVDDEFEQVPGATDVPAEDGVEPDPESVVDPNATGDSVAPVPGSTEPPAAEPVPVTRIAIGDSVMLGAAEQLRERGFAVDAIESRAWVSGIDIVETLQREDRLPSVLVLHLGTNGPIGQAGMDRMMAAVADVPQVLLVTNDLPDNQDLASSNNALMIDAASANPNVEVLYWDGLASQCVDDCLYQDGIHLKSAGQRYYAQLIDDTLAG
ncbi:MAG: acyltransferase family protein, partial [Ilumatobacter sp.]